MSDVAVGDEGTELSRQPPGTQHSALSTRHSVLGTWWRLIAFTRTGTIGAAILIVFCLVAIASPLLSPADPVFQDLPNRSKFISPDHPLGTDTLGRDLLSRIIYGARISLTLGVMAVVLGGLLGIPLGLVSGYLGKLPDMIIMRVVD